MPLDPSAEKFLNRLEQLFEPLREHGWIDGGGFNDQDGIIGFQFNLDPDRDRISPEEALECLPIVEEDGSVAEGYEVGTDADMGEQLYVRYDGPLDERFENVVAAMLELSVRDEDLYPAMAERIRAFQSETSEENTSEAKP